MKPKLIKLEDNIVDSLQDSLYQTLGLEKFQLYFPAMSLYFNYYNNDSYKKFTLDSKYLLKNLEKPLEDEFKDSYIKHMYNGTIFNTKDKTEENCKVFLKMSPILDVISYLKNEYNLSHSDTPNIFSYMTNNKINSYHNSAYIDNLFTYLGSKYNEKNLCPSFPEYYGGFIGVSSKYEFDITEEYDMIEECTWFKRCKDTLFKLRIEEISKELETKIEFEKKSPTSEVSNEIHNDVEFDNLSDILDESEWETEPDEQTMENNDNDSVSSLPSSISEINCINDKIYYCQFKKFPVQVVAMEKMAYTLENLIEELNYEMSEKEWLGVLFQICFALSVGFKNNKFVHNDLHCSNVMFKETEDEYLYYKYKSNVYRIPTFGKITKIIDFGRATFEIKNQVFFSDVFKKNGDAEGQYSFPYTNTLKGCKIKPNPSFDLCRLSKTIIDYIPEDSDVYKLLELWSSDKYGNNLLYHDDDFDLYKLIARDVKSAVPIKQLEKKVFKRFIIDETEVPDNVIIYNL